MTSPTNARLRWNLLKVALVHKQDPTRNGLVKHISTRIFEGFGLFEKHRLPSHWIIWKLKGTSWSLLLPALPFRQLLEPAEFGSRLSSNNNETGIVCVWPSEEVLSWFLYHWFQSVAKDDEFSGKYTEILPKRLLNRCQRICELGGGQSCLGGLMAASLAWPNIKEVILSDGNSECCRVISSIVSHNHATVSTWQAKIAVKNLNWCHMDEKWDLLESSCDLVLLADCLFFEETNVDLAKALSKLLKPGGFCLILAPLRGGSVDRFYQMLCDGMSLDSNLTTKRFVHYADFIYQLHEHHLDASGLYRPELHYPVCLCIEKNLI